MASPPFFKRKPRKRNTTVKETSGSFFSRFCHLRVCKTVRAFVGFVCLLRPSFLGLQNSISPVRPSPFPEGGQACLWAEGRQPRPGPARRRGGGGVSGARAFTAHAYLQPVVRRRRVGAHRSLRVHVVEASAAGSRAASCASPSASGCRTTPAPPPSRAAGCRPGL